MLVGTLLFCVLVCYVFRFFVVFCVAIHSWCLFGCLLVCLFVSTRFRAFRRKGIVRYLGTGYTETGNPLRNSCETFQNASQFVARDASLVISHDRLNVR